MAAPTTPRTDPPRTPVQKLRDRLTGASAGQDGQGRQPWRVEGAQGPADPGSQPQRPSWRRFWWLLILLLVVNWIVSSVLLGPEPRTTVAYTFFVSQVQAGNVAGGHVDRRHHPGRLQEGGRLHPAGRRARSRSPVSPRAADVRRRQPVRHAAAHGRAGRTRTRRTRARPSGCSCCSASARPCCWSGCSSRSAGGCGGGAGRARSASFGRSRATLYKPEAGPRTTFADVAGIDEVEGRGHRDRRLPPRARAVPPAGRADPARACCCRGRPAAARPCSPERSRARRRCRSSRSPPRSSSRRSSASAPAGCATCSNRPRRWPRRSSSSTSSTPSGGPAAAPVVRRATTSGSRRSTRSSPRWTASPAPKASSCSPRPTAPRSSTRPCCGRAASTAGSP